mgnify:CR=1 FL=1
MLRKHSGPEVPHPGRGRSRRQVDHLLPGTRRRKISAGTRQNRIQSRRRHIVVGQPLRHRLQPIPGRIRRFRTAQPLQPGRQLAAETAQSGLKFGHLHRRKRGRSRIGAAEFPDQRRDFRIGGHLLHDIGKLGQRRRIDLFPSQRRSGRFQHPERSERIPGPGYRIHIQRIDPALQLIKTAPGQSIVSSVFFMLMPDQVLVYGDCAINPNPTAAQLADIAIQSAASARAFGIEPRVAMISYSTGSSGTGDDVEKVREATRLVREACPDLMIDGPIQYDAASVQSVGLQKAPHSPVAGRANVFVFPDLNTGNNTYKAVQRSANVVSIGPMLQGLRKPVNDLSRGALVDDIVYTIALTAIQADTPV